MYGWGEGVCPAFQRPSRGPKFGFFRRNCVSSGTQPRGSAQHRTPLPDVRLVAGPIPEDSACHRTPTPDLRLITGSRSPRTATRTQGTGAPSKGSISSAARCCAPHGTAPCGRNVGVRRMGGWGARGHATSPGGAPAPPLRGTPRVSGPERARVSPRKWN
eukprot:gene832-biopygen7670